MAIDRMVRDVTVPADAPCWAGATTRASDLGSWLVRITVPSKAAARTSCSHSV
ncbi:hypothetical protein [Streptomyces sp. D54]|uniref:hypothetical protein n=1 Tax=Streptomyces sp. D54 TaxID=1290289 RepID=UPI003CECB067